MSTSNSILEYLLENFKKTEPELPLYQKIVNIFSEAIKSNKITKDEKLPSERVLAKYIGVSRATVRRAFEDLSASGLLKKKHGASSLVNLRVEKTLSSLKGFSAELRDRGTIPKQKWLLKEISLPTPSETISLGISPMQNVIRLVRIRFADDVPIAIERAAVPQNFLSSPDLVTDSLYAALLLCKKSPVRGTQRIRAGVMTRAEAEALNSSVGAPLLIIERQCFLENGRAVEFTETRYHGERYDFISDLQSDQLIR